MEKRIQLQEAINMIDDGMTIMIGGFMGIGSPHTIIEGLLESGKKNLTIICSDTSVVDKGIGRLIVNNQVAKVIASHIGTNRETGRQMNEGLIEVELVPQGTLAEQIRSGGAGLGGVLTPIGIGTPIEDDNETVEIEGMRYILAKSIRADIALIHGSVVEENGNIFYNQSTRNFNPLMATAADIVIVEAEKVVKSGDLDPHLIATPGLFINHIVEGA